MLWDNAERRAGLDLNPLDVTDPDDIAWLEALIWPEHSHRRPTTGITTCGRSSGGVPLAWTRGH